MNLRKVLTIGSLFAGIGGFDLAGKWMGWETKWFSEIEPYASAVLKKHWPNVPNHGDITKIKGENVEHVDILCGGFPCQDISFAGKGAGLAGERSGLWSHYARLIEEIRPRYVVAENVSALRSRGLDEVLRSLAALGYDAEWHCVPAAALGAPHRRDRIWIIASGPDANGARSQGWDGSIVSERACEWAARQMGSLREVPHTESDGRGEKCANGRGCGERNRTEGDQRCGLMLGSALEHASSGRHRPQKESVCSGRDSAFDPGWWFSEPNVGRVADGIPRRVDRLRCLGNAIVPQVAYFIFQAIAAQHARPES